VLSLTQIDRTMISRVGGKAANLGELTRAGFAVPQGFCVSTEAYREVVELAGLDGLLARAGSAASGDDLAEAARELIVGAPVPEHIRRAILDAYTAMSDESRSGPPMVAVRSSATAEDLPFASFAGQQDTYLGVVGEDQLLDAVRRCWASLWTDRAVAYRGTQQIDHRSARLAVVVQSMVHSETAGVVFTANPVTGRRREAVIDASPGLGEAVVSGAVTPDHLVVDTATGRILDSRVGQKGLAIRALPGGGTQRFTAAATDQLCLTVEQTRELARIGDTVERHYGAPQDIEWAFDPDGRLWLTQTRPITTLYPLPEGKEPRDLRVYLNFNVAQGLYRPMTPMGTDAIRILTSGVAHMLGNPESADPTQGSPQFVEAGQRIFLDLTGVLRSRVGRTVMPKVFDIMETRSAAIMRSLFDRPEFSITQRSVLPAVRRVARVAVRYKIPLYAAQALLSPAAAQRRLARIGADTRVRLMLHADVAPAERLDRAVKTLYLDTAPLAPKALPGALVGLAMFGLAARLLRGISEPGQLQGVLRGLPDNVTTEMDLELWRLTVRIRGDRAAANLLASAATADLAQGFTAGTLPPALQDGLAGFLGKYGHRAVAEIDLGMPRWADDPSHLLGVLANYLRSEDPGLAPDAVFAASSASSKQMIARLAAAAGARARWRAPVVRFALGRTRELAGVREIPKYYMVLTLAAVRRDIAAVGQALAADGRIDTADDVFFLTIAEARSGLAGRGMQDLVTGRRESYQQELRRRRLPRVLLSDGTEPENTGPAPTSSDGAMVGVAASPGVVTGRARVILDPTGARLEPGEILVAPSTDPGWTPLFLTAGGLVMEMGGANSHGAVVAREYGIPAVVGMPLATERISTGDLVTVNGTLGTVTVDPAGTENPSPEKAEPAAASAG
jgi:pyruvate,water dikinase